MQQFIFFFFFFCWCSVSVAQSSFRKLSRPEKCWVLFHPLKARKALRVTREVQLTVDSVKQSGIIGSDNNGGKLDAFKHAFWMSMLSDNIGKKQSLKLGKAHEKGNYLQYKKRLLEDSLLPDHVSSQMDIKNNEAGAGSIGRCHFNIAAYELKMNTLRMLYDGELFIIKKNAQGNYIDCSGSLIDMKIWIGKWDIPKCLITSNEQ